jgi:hypothetical protein
LILSAPRASICSAQAAAADALWLLRCAADIAQQGAPMTASLHDNILSTKHAGKIARATAGGKA